MVYKTCRLNITIHKTPLNFTEEVKKDLDDFAPKFKQALTEAEWENFTNCFDFAFDLANKTDKDAFESLQVAAYILYKLYPDDIKYMDRYAVTILESSKVEAFKIFQLVCDKEANYDNCYHNLGKISYGIGIWEYGDKMLDKCLEIDESNMPCLRTIIYVNKV